MVKRALHHMYVATAVITFRLDASGSLKDKRQVTKSVLARLRNQFSVAAAEVGALESWNLAVIGLAYVSNDANHAQEVIEHATRYIEESRPDVEITSAQFEVMTVE